MAQQRKFRNKEEREKIKAEVLGKLEEVGLNGNVPGVGTFLKVLDDFVANQDNGKFFTGTVKLPEVKLEIIYVFQGRRILPYAAKVQRST